jgi:hypothetical protein
VDESADPPRAAPEDYLALDALRMLANGMGGIDWAGVPIVFALLGVEDPEDVIHRMTVIKSHRPPGQG